MRRFLKLTLRLALILLITMLLLEFLLQLAFPLLPAALIRNMPQYRLRMGFQLHTEHGVIEYPAAQRVEYEVTPQFGDLYRLTCLSPAAAPPTDSYRVAYTRDSHGFRNLDPWPDMVDLVIVGDSFTAAEASAAPFWQDLSDSMLVLGLPGSGTVEHQRLLETHALPRDPRVVILAYFAGNDLLDNQDFVNMERDGLTALDLVYRDRNLTEFLVSVHLLIFLRDALAPASIEDCQYPQIAETNPPTPLAFFDRFLPMLAMDRQTLLASEMWQLARKKHQRNGGRAHA